MSQLMTPEQPEPFFELSRLQSDIQRLFDGDGETMDGPSDAPGVDIYEDNEGVLLRMDVAEANAKDLDVRCEGGVLTIRGERKLDRDETKDDGHHLERHHGSFARSFRLPSSLDAEHILAGAEDGVLRVQIPRRAEAKARSVQPEVPPSLDEGF